MDEDEELLQDFLVEAGEILEQLNEQLVDLEQRPKDTELLNAVFRGFHTVKGGASFLSLNALVEVCHRAEDVFNALRSGEKDVDARVMDVILPVVDVVNSQFDELRAGQEPSPADPALLQQLEGLLSDEAPAPAAAAPAPAAPPAEEPVAEVDPFADTADVEFDAMVDAAKDTQTAESDEITEDEFEALLDQLHGEGKHSSVAGDTTAGTPAVDLFGEEPSGEETAAPAEAASDEITEDEFEDLLDKLHGKGGPTGAPTAPQAPSQPTASTPAAGASPAVAKPAPKPAAAEKPAVAAVEKTEVAAAKKEAPAAKEAPAVQAETTVRVDTKRLDDIMNMVGELVLVRNRVATLGMAVHDDEMAKVVSNLDVVTADLQSAIMKTRMQPIKKVFGRFPRVIRDLARNLKKEINLEMQGEETDLDKNLVEALADPLVHLVRNAVDHGIESPEQREAVGKPRAGTVMLTAEQEGDHILLMIQDDGKGMNPDNLRNAAVAKGMMDAETAARLENKECFNLIFAPGFSTKQEISDVSGRGVGMDVVKTRIEQLNGTVEIDSEEGRGSIIRIQVPLTLAIMPTLMV